MADFVTDGWGYRESDGRRVIELRFSMPDLGMSHFVGCYLDLGEEAAKAECLAAARDYARFKREKMGVNDMRMAFNSVLDGRGTATKALLSYKPQHDIEWQILQFRGTWADGTAFDVKSEPLRPGSDVVAASRQTAQRMLDEAGK